MTCDEIKAAVDAWLTERIGAPTGPEESFVESLDSFDVVEFVTFCEQTFGIRFSASDLQSAEFRTIAGVVGIISDHVRRAVEVS